MVQETRIPRFGGSNPGDDPPQAPPTPDPLASSSRVGRAGQRAGHGESRGGVFAPTAASAAKRTGESSPYSICRS